MQDIQEALSVLSLAQEDLAVTPFAQLVGSPLYLPPEALQGARALSARSDQYSLAVVLYECVTGRPPFIGESLLSLLNAIALDFSDSRVTLDPNAGVVSIYTFDCSGPFAAGVRLEIEPRCRFLRLRRQFARRSERGLRGSWCPRNQTRA